MSEPLFDGADTTSKKKEDKALALLRRRFPPRARSSAAS